MNDSSTTIEEVKQTLKKFIDERDWEQFHKPKDVAIALSVEASELLEHFTFKSEEQIRQILADPKQHEKLADEAADVLAYLSDFARVTKIDLAKAFEQKMEKNRKKYPVDVVKGKNNKYSDYN